MTFEEILQGMMDRVPSNVDKREGSVIYDALAPCAYFLAQMYFQLENFIDLVFPDTAAEGYLDRAVEAYGVSRKPAAAAVRELRTSGLVEIGSRWGIQNVVYEVTGTLEENRYEASCETAGAVGNQYSGPAQPLSGSSGVAAELGEILVPGVDRESDEDLRERFFQKVRQPATSGNAYHYRLWAMEVSGVGNAKVFPLDRGPGTVTVLVVNEKNRADGTLIEPTAEYLEEVRPIGAEVTVESPEEMKIDVSAEILLDGTQEKAQVETAFADALTAYLDGLVFETYRVSYAWVGSILLSTPGVKDYRGLLLNSAAGNVTVGEKAIPVPGTIELREVEELGTVSASAGLL